MLVKGALGRRNRLCRSLCLSMVFVNELKKTLHSLTVNIWGPVWQGLHAFKKEQKWVHWDRQPKQVHLDVWVCIIITVNGNVFGAQDALVPRLHGAGFGGPEDTDKAPRRALWLQRREWIMVAVKPRAGRA